MARTKGKAEGEVERGREEEEGEGEGEGGGKREEESGFAGGQPPLTRVPTVFSSTREYVDVFEPLILEECRAQIVRAPEDGGEAPWRGAPWVRLRASPAGPPTLAPHPLTHPGYALGLPTGTHPSALEHASCPAVRLPPPSLAGVCPGWACEVVAPTKLERAHEFWFLAVTAEPRVVERFSENDLVLVAREKVGAVQYCLASVT